MKKKKTQEGKIQISGSFLNRIYANIPITVYESVDDVISFLNQKKFPYLWPNEKNHIKWVKEYDNPQEALKYFWHLVYLHHPNPKVRKAVVELNANNDDDSISEDLCQLLVDPDEDVRISVYKATWQREKHDYCKPIIEKLSDEIKGFDIVGPAALGQEEAIIALKKLIEYAPDTFSKEKILENIKSAGLYEYIDEIKEKEAKGSKKEKEGGVKFIEEIKKEENIMGAITTLTYEIYNAANKKQAIEFLRTKSVRKEWYFIEVKVGDVNNPEVVIGVDINGHYEI